MLRPVGLAARPSGSRPGSCWWSPSAGAGLGFDEAEDEQRDSDDADQRVDAVVVVQEDRADLERLLGVAVAAFDDLLVLVEAQDVARR